MPQELDSQINESSNTPSHENMRRHKNKKTRPENREENISQKLGNLTAILHQSIKARQEENSQDYNKMFILSLLNGFKQIPEQLKSKAQIELIQVINVIHPSILNLLVMGFQILLLNTVKVIQVIILTRELTTTLILTHLYQDIL